MAVRNFNGSTDNLTLGAGGLTAWNSAAQATSMLVLVEIITAQDPQGIFSVAQFPGANVLETMYVRTTDLTTMYWGDDTPGQDVSVSSALGLATSTWYLLGLAKGAGTVVGTAHRKQLGAGSWLHGALGSTIATNSAGAPTSVPVMSFGGTSAPTAGRIATAALWTRKLTDLEYESVDTAKTTASIYALGPTLIWDFNQASVATAVTELQGITSADQIDRVGTTVVNGDDPPGWVFGLAPAAAGTPDRRMAQRHSRMTSW